MSTGQRAGDETGNFFKTIDNVGEQLRTGINSVADGIGDGIAGRGGSRTPHTSTDTIYPIHSTGTEKSTPSAQTTGVTTSTASPASGPGSHFARSHHHTPMTDGNNDAKHLQKEANRGVNAVGAEIDKAVHPSRWTRMKARLFLHWLAMRERLRRKHLTSKPAKRF